MQRITLFHCWLPWALKLGCLVLLADFAWADRPTVFSAGVASLAVAVVLLTLGKREMTFLNVCIMWSVASGLGWAAAGIVHLVVPGIPHGWLFAYLAAQAMMVITQDIREVETAASRGVV